MRLDLKNIFQYYFPNCFEMFIIGFILLIVSLPGIGMIFMRHDDIFPNLLGRWGDVATVGACVIGFLGIILIFCGFRQSALPGTLVYRLTHLR
jgi:uncharacterized membrane protein